VTTTAQGLAALLALTSFVAMVLLGRKHWSGWVVGLVSQALLAYLTWPLWGITALCVANSLLYTYNLAVWKRAAKSPVDGSAE